MQNRASLRVATVLCDFIEQDVLPGLAIEKQYFWQNFCQIIEQFSTRNGELLAQRQQLQQQIDQWFGKHPNATVTEEKAFLRGIGYLVEEVADFSIETSAVDPEISQIAGPQLVVPIKNARYALNASNARWGSLYDALYGSDIISAGNRESGRYDPLRGASVIDFSRAFLDDSLPLKSGSHRNAVRYHIENKQLHITQRNGEQSVLAAPAQWVGYRGNTEQPDCILLQHHRLHIEIRFDRNGQIGRDDSAGIEDILLESAVTAIQDCEDSVAAVDAEDKVAVYKNWLGLMRGDLQVAFNKGGQRQTRRLAKDRDYCTPAGGNYRIAGRSLLLLRNVGHLMSSDAVIDPQGRPIPEGILDAVITATIALYDLRSSGEIKNSRSDSIYIVKPKMHGPEEVSFACELFDAVETMLSLKKKTIKIGIMDEERRTSLNLKACIYAARERIIFINTGFLDRTGDEIHSTMARGATLCKEQMKQSRWLQAYEKSNVAIGLQCGFSGRAQIGKGMWAMPDEMKKMLDCKGEQLQSGANCAWVPSPTAATLHAIHYHQTDVTAIQQALKENLCDSEQRNYRDELLHPATIDLDNPPDSETVQKEIDNNVQAILGYVVRWIDSGIGCSKVPNIQHIDLMEDRATLRIASQHLANWLRHEICSKEQVLGSLHRMARIVDKQNENDDEYRSMSGDPEENIAFNAARALIFEGERQPSGYTEPLLHAMRRERKQRDKENLS